ncbi:UDP-N-acetylglucosamine 2-epimerase [Sporosarcina sp. FSL K6-2383]|uniref:UDP-N-acetylglucosamine 2-epimerase n=1 Tax=Sporosarcina sp. FSL K6-2383 TaxID=2921556 RepID=UPI00315A2E02
MISLRRKICVVTGTRAEYGLLYWLMKEIQQDVELELQLVVTGMHLSPEFGLTYKQIEEDGFIIDEKVEMLLSGDTPSAIAKSIGLGTIGFADTFTRLQPDILVLLGDRFEALSAAQTAVIHRIPIAHLHGGELTEGLIDEPIRHSLTKMSHLHFTAAEPYRKRVIQMGEQPDRVFNVGATGIDGIKKTTLLSKEELSESLQFELERYFLITLHPTTLENQTGLKHVELLLKVLDEYEDYQLIFTKTNADTEGRVINERIEAYVGANPTRARLYDSLGQVRYLSALKHCKVVIGNSSSGLIEAPVFHKPTINIGDRQRGRLKAISVIDSRFEYQEIVETINKAISSDFKLSIENMELPYGEGETAKKIYSILKEVNLKNLVKKVFFDIEDIK